MPRAPFDNRARLAFIIACLTLAASGLLFQGAVRALNLYMKKQPVDLRAPLTLIPTTIGRWKAVGEDRSFDAAMIEELGTDKYLDRMYVNDERPPERLLVHLAYYTGMIDTVPHVPDRCLVAAGFNAKSLAENLPLPMDRSAWSPDPEGLIHLATKDPYQISHSRDLAGRIVTVRMPVGDMEMRTVRFEHEKDPAAQIYGGYFFIANGGLAPAPEQVKLLAFDPREKYAYYCKVQYVYVSRDGTQERFLTLVAEHLKDLLPELMRCLPDWAEVERRDQAKPSPTAS